MSVEFTEAEKNVIEKVMENFCMQGEFNDDPQNCRFCGAVYSCFPLHNDFCIMTKIKKWIEEDNK